jgi:hypothetical protein
MDQAGYLIVVIKSRGILKNSFAEVLDKGKRVYILAPYATYHLLSSEVRKCPGNNSN